MFVGKADAFAERRLSAVVYFFYFCSPAECMDTKPDRLTKRTLSEMITTEMEISACNFADPTHRQAIGELINVYIADEMGGGTRLSDRQRLRLVDGLQKCPQAIVLLAGRGGVWCGLLVAFENFSTFAVQPMINIHDLIVRKEYRGQGVGRELMNALVVEAESRKCSRITLEVRQDNLAAQGLYKDLGFGDTVPPMFYWRKELLPQKSPEI